MNNGDNGDKIMQQSNKVCYNDECGLQRPLRSIVASNLSAVKLYFSPFSLGRTRGVSLVNEHPNKVVAGSYTLHLQAMQDPSKVQPVKKREITPKLSVH